MATAGKNGTVKIVGTGIAFTNEACTLVSGKRYKITNRVKKVWDSDLTLTVKDNGATVSSANILKIYWLIGHVEFVSGYTVTGPVTVTGTYLPTSTVAGIKDYSASFTVDLMAGDTFKTAEDNTGFKEKVNGLYSASGSINGFYETTQGFAALLIAGSRVIIEMVSDRAATGSYIVDTLLDKVGADTKVEDLNRISVSWQTKKEAFYE